MRLKIKGKKLQELRAFNGMSQRAFANAFVLSQSEIALLESGKRQYLYISKEYLSRLPAEDLRKWLLHCATHELQLQISAKLTTGRTNKLFGALPPAFIESNQSQIIDSIIANYHTPIAA